MALVHAASQLKRWDWAAIGVNSSRARGSADTAEEAVASAVSAVGTLMLLELRDPEGTVTRRGLLVERAQQCAV